MQRVCATRIRGTYAGMYSSAYPALESMGITEFYPIPDTEYKQGYLIYKVNFSFYCLYTILYDWDIISKSSRNKIIKQEDSLVDVVVSLFAKGAMQIDIHDMVILRKQAELIRVVYSRLT